ncbi:MAG: ATP-binding cassette domain-containing protein [Burkholderiaceae bacterium]|nr:ATP-binding cassette domain-containing protein [Burkholderiaceae bacterium]MCD8516136.1 ATP-binding cassette domain-containing protein [Burkholderiaceae bacterium]MCD8537835.1 ATP-binding cassette domain-containing protein [Burkholderiaceae bacterium]MCD8566144.1 ATP-binding cassette domain-containing protein [Burkholderiaceae bacterium]
MTIWRYLLKLYQPRAGWLLIAFLSLTVTWLSAAALLAVSGWFITACAMAGLGLIVNLNIFTPSAAIRGLAILRTVGRYAERVIGHEAILRSLADLRVRAFVAVANRPAKDIDNRRYADLVNRLTADVDTLDGVPLRVIGPLLAAFLTWIAVVVIGAIWGGAAIASVIGLGGLLTFTISVWLARAGYAHGRTVIQARVEQRIAMIDHFGGLGDLLAYRKASASHQRLQALDQAQTARLIDQERYASWSEHGVQALTALMTLTVLALSLHKLDPAVVTLLALMTLGMNEALGTLPGAFWRIGESTEAGQRLMHLESTSHKSENPPNGFITASKRGNHSLDTVDIKGLCCQRQPNTHQLLTAQLKPGQPLIIHGQSGTGKTSLLSTLAGELTPIAGHVMFDNIDLLSLDDTQRFGFVGFLSQNDQLLDLTIREFLSLGLNNVHEEDMRQALQAVDLLETLENTDEGFEYRLGIGGSRISGGQARRLQLSALLLRDPALVLLDEPFRGLQSDLVQTILTRIEPWLSRRCCVIVTHDPKALPNHWPRMAWPSGLKLRPNQ